MKKLLSSQKGLAKIGIVFFIVEFIRKFATMPMFHEPNLLEIFYILNLFTIFFGSIAALYNDKIWGKRLNLFGYTFLMIHPILFIMVNISIVELKEFYRLFFSPYIIIMAPGYLSLAGITIVLPALMIRLWLKAHSNLDPAPKNQ